MRQRAYLAQRLARLRFACGYKTARAFAQAIGQTESAYRRYEAGEAEPDIELYYKMLGVLGVTASELLGNFNEPVLEAGPSAAAQAVSGFAEPDADPKAALKQAVATEDAIWTLAECFLALTPSSESDAATTRLWRFHELSTIADTIREAPHQAIAAMRQDQRLANATPALRDLFTAAAEQVADVAYGGR